MAYRLPNSFSSPQQIEALLGDIEKLKPTMLSTPQKWPTRVQEFAMSNALASLTLASQSKLVGYLKELLATSPQISLVVANMPNGEELAELTGWFRSHIHPHTTLHIAQNSDVIAGCVLRTDEAVYDFSLRSGLFANSEKLAKRLAHA